MIVQCEHCREPICSDCDAEEIEDGKYLCEDCFEDYEIEQAAKGSDSKVMPEKQCGRCSKRTREYIDKNEGPRCIKCAHKLELEIHSAGHDAETCTICTPPKKAA